MKRNDHAAHYRFEKSKPAAQMSGRRLTPSQFLDPQDPAIVEKLELLDDAVFEAVDGNEAALNRLRVLWPRLRLELGEDLLSESREQYLRYAMSVWKSLAEGDETARPERSSEALDVICLLFE